jgi:type I restriction enzyme, S subunit
MDAQTFLAEFGHIATAPGGVLKLRMLVIQLAISGKLVDQIVGERSVAEAIAAATNLRQEYEARLTLHASRSEPPLKKGPFIIPSHWTWVRLEQLALYIQRGKGPQYAERGNTVAVSQKCVKWSGLDLRSARFVADDSLGSYDEERFLCSGDLLWNSTGTGTVGRIAVYEPKEGLAAVADSHVTIVRLANFLPRYIWCVIASPWVQTRFEPAHKESLVSGSTQQVELATSTARKLPIPCPPIEEQARIVAKVDELMSLCDKLEIQQEEGRGLQKKSREAALESLRSAATPRELQSAWARLAENFSSLFQLSEDIAEFLEKVKDLAVRGVLTSSTHESPNVAEIVKACSALRTSYIAEGLMRKQKFISAPKRHVNFPQNWTIAAFDDCAVIIGGVTKGRDLRGKDVVTCPYLGVANVQRGYFNLTEVKQIQIAKDELPKYRVREGDLLITEGGDWDKVGRTAIWRGGIENCLHQNHVFKARVPSGDLLNEWIELVFNSSVGRDYFARASKQTTNLASINMTQLRSFPVPVPPLPEQQSILEKIQNLTVLSAAWQNRVSQKRKLASFLASMAVSNITGIAAAPEEEEQLEVPKTQLIAPLLLGQAPDVKNVAPLATILAHHNGEMSAKDLWQRFGGEIDAFYAQLKHEVAQGWIREPAIAEMRQETA